jgi:NAD(P)-dependent dehydrogenase (short-subunit alcohol dehydrogenase family)
MSQNFFSLKNKTAVITGAAGGLGQHFAFTLAKAGANIILIDCRHEALEKVRDELKAFRVKVIPILVDLSQPTALVEALSRIYAKNLPIDILVNCAGIGEGTPIESTSFEQAFEQIERHYAIHLRATWLLSHEIAKHMIQYNIQGSIINISSVCGDRSPGTFNAIYSAMKAGMIQMTRSMSLELASKGIRVNAILPGLFDTPMAEDIINSKDFNRFMERIPLGRIGSPEDLEGILLLLASNKASSYMTGSLITVDGGASNSSLYRKPE